MTRHRRTERDSASLHNDASPPHAAAVRRPLHDRPRHNRPRHDRHRAATDTASRPTLQFSDESLVYAHNGELADTLGNLVHRVFTLCGKVNGSDSSVSVV